MIPNSEAFWFDDPECCLDSLGGKRSNRAIEALKNGGDGLVTWPQDDHTGRATGIIPSRIREVSVERDEDPLLTLAGFLNWGLLPIEWVNLAGNRAKDEVMELIGGGLRV